MCELGKAGSPVHPDRFSHLFDELVKKSALPKIRLHDLRHLRDPRAAARVSPESSVRMAGTLLSLLYHGCVCAFDTGHEGRDRKCIGGAGSWGLALAKCLQSVPEQASQTLSSKRKAPRMQGFSKARLARLERATFGFVDQRSIQLSYRRTLAEKEGFEPSKGAFTPSLA